MKKLSLISLMSCLGVFIQLSATAQSTRPFNPLKDEISDMIPPLSVLLDSAYAHDPGLKSSNSQILIQKANLKTTRNLWAQSMGLQANAGYGTFDYVYNNTGTQGVNQPYISRQNQTQYQAGAWFYLPLSTVTNHRNQVQLAKLLVDQSRNTLASQHNELQKAVIKQYNDMIATQRLLKIRSNYLETARINMQVAEKSFLNGTITIDEYSRVSEIASRTEGDYELTRMDFLTAYLTLEVMVGMKFNLTNEIPLNHEGK